MMCLDAAIREDIRKKLKVCMDFRAKIDITIVKKYTPPTQSESIMAQQKEKNVFPIFLSVCKKYP